MEWERGAARRPGRLAVVGTAAVTRWLVALVLLLPQAIDSSRVAAAPATVGLAAPAGGVPRADLYSETFADNRAGWPESETRYFAEDGYHLIGEERDTPTLFSIQARNTPRLADIAFEARLRLVDGSDTRSFGISVRSTTAPRRVYQLFVNSLGMFQLWRNAAGDAAALVSWRRAAAWEFGEAWNDVRLVARGKTLSAWINGQQIAWAQDVVIPEDGAIQLNVSNGQHVVFQSLRVWEPTEQDVATMEAVPPLFNDYLFDNREGWSLGDTHYVDTDGLHVVVPPRDRAWIQYLGARSMPFIADVDVEAEMRPVDGIESRGFGIATRMSSTGQYRLLINAEGSFSLEAFAPSGARVLIPWQRSPALKPGLGVSNTIRLIARGGQLMVVLNGQQAAALQDDATVDRGGTMLTVRDGLHVVVRRVTVREPDVAQATPTPQTSPGPSTPATQTSATPSAPAPQTSPTAAPATPVPTAVPRA